MSSKSVPLAETPNLGDPSSMPSAPVPSNPSEANPSPPNTPVPPQNQPQADEPDRYREQIASGFFIPFSEAVAWLKKTHGMDLGEDYSQYLTLGGNMMVTMQKHGYPANFELAQGPDPTKFDLLYVTRRIHGNFVKVEPAGEEVLQDCFKQVMKRGELEEETHEAILEIFG